MPHTITYTIIYIPNESDKDQDAFDNDEEFTPYECDEKDCDPEFFKEGAIIPRNRIIKTIKEGSLFSIDHVIVKWSGYPLEGCVHRFPLKFSTLCVVETVFEMCCDEELSSCFYNFDEYHGSSFANVAYDYCENVAMFTGRPFPNHMFKRLDKNTSFIEYDSCKYEPKNEQFVAYGGLTVTTCPLVFINRDIPVNNPFLFKELTDYADKIDEEDCDVCIQMH